MKKILLVVVAALTSIFATFGQDIYKLFIKEKIFTNKVIQQNISDDKKKEIAIFLSKDGLQEKTPTDATEIHTEQDLEGVINLTLKTDGEFYQKFSYRYSLHAEHFIKNHNDIKLSKKIGPKRKAQGQEEEIVKFETFYNKMKEFRRKYQNCTRDAKILNNPQDTKLHTSDKNSKIEDKQKEELLKKEISEKYKIKKTELDCKKLILLELDRFPLG